MMDFSNLTSHPIVEELVEAIVNQTQSKNKKFFRLMVNYYLTIPASMMRASLETVDRGSIIINMYGLSLASSGTGKGYTKGLLEENVINQFKKIFFDTTLPLLEEEKLNKLAAERSYIKNTSPDEELLEVQKEYKSAGEYFFAFSEGTAAAFKQMRSKLLMTEVGALNCIIDEIGNNLLSSQDMLNMYIETFDQGKIDNKLIKNSSDNKRVTAIDGKVPCNLLMFGTPVAILDGHKVETDFMKILDTGYGRRCFFSYTPKLVNGISELDGELASLHVEAKRIFKALSDGSISKTFHKVSNRLSELASYQNYAKKIPVPQEVSELLLVYKLYCEIKADKLPEYQSILKAELAHRYFKAIKLAGAYAFYEGTAEITKEQLSHAIFFAEESGEAMIDIMNRDANYIRLAKFIADQPGEITQVDLIESLSWYKGTSAHRADLMQMATTWGYTNHVLIKKSFKSGIEFISAETLHETDLDNCILSYSTDIAYNYINPEVPVKFTDLHQLTSAPDFHWINHHLTDGHRQGSSIVQGFNLLVLDVDGGSSIKDVQKLLQDFTYMIHTTKSHTDQCNRFRIVLPMNYILKLNKDDYRQFYSNLLDWFPFSMDTVTGQRARKWETNANAQVYYNEGELIDVLSFIPNTSKNTEREDSLKDAKSLSNLERWFSMNTGNGNRSANLVRYALMLVDAGKNLSEVKDAVYTLNKKLPEGITKREIDATIMTTAAKRFTILNP